MKRFLLSIGALCLAGALARADDKPYLYTQFAASTATTGVFKVGVDVTVENRGKSASKEGKVELTLKPTGAGSHPKGGMWDPLVKTQDMPALQPGERKSFTFETDYISKYTFKNQRGSFKVNNVDPTGIDVTVSATVKTIANPDSGV